MNRKNKIVSLAVLFASIAPLVAFGQTAPTPSQTPSQVQQNRPNYTTPGGTTNDHNRPGDNDRDRNRGDRDNRDNRDNRDRDHRGDRNRGDFRWDRNNWKHYNWRGYNWRGYGAVNDVLTGRVLDVSPGSVLVMGNNGTTYLVGTETARIVNRYGMPVSNFRLRQGDRVIISGVMRDFTVYAVTIRDVSL